MAQSREVHATVKLAVGPPAAGAVTVTGVVFVFVAPPLSVTVSWTSKVPAAENVWLAFLVVALFDAPLVASPKFQAYDATLPSVSPLWSVNPHARSLHEKAKPAVGGALG